MQANYTYKDLLIKFGEGRQKLAVRFDPIDPFTKNFLYKQGHRQMIEHLFKQQYGMKVVRHSHIYEDSVEVINVVRPGLIYSRTDSEIHPQIEVWGIVGESIIEDGEARN